MEYLAKESIAPLQKPYPEILRSLSARYIVVAVTRNGKSQPIYIGTNPDWTTEAAIQIARLTNLKLLLDHI